LNQDARPPTFGKFYELLREVAAADAWVTVRWPAQSGLRDYELQTLALHCQWWDSKAGENAWPRWWSDELDRKHSERWSQWHLYRAHKAGILKREHVATA
jgi:hypothetical protein